MQTKNKTRKSDELGLLPALALLAAFLVLCAVVVYAFASASYLGPALAAVAGVALIAVGAICGDAGRGEVGNNAASTAIMFAGAFLILIGGVGALMHFLRAHF